MARIIFHLVLVLIAAIVGYLITTIQSGSLETEFTIGFPLPWGAWSCRTGRCIDFVSPLSVVIWMIDWVLGFTATYLVGLTARYLIKREPPISLKI